MELELSTVKKFLRVDFDEDDDIIELEIQAAREYVISAVGKCDETKALVRLLVLNLVTTMYEDRAMTVATNQKANYTTRSIISQLQADEYGEDDK